MPNGRPESRDDIEGQNVYASWDGDSAWELYSADDEVIGVMIPEGPERGPLFGATVQWGVENGASASEPSMYRYERKFRTIEEAFAFAEEHWAAMRDGKEVS